jgi:2-C-methyl-D-erythritol 4-phosphate cytidylyltransferase/2-C-methyl-D-erythritol 2,4-cyclodiphosphate synthase
VTRSSDPDFAGVVVAAGLSSRCSGDRPKQFEDLAGRSVLQWSVAALAGHPRVGSVVVVLSEEEITAGRSAEISSWAGVTAVIAGGETRAESVRLGVSAAGPVPYVLVHDAARPLAGPGLIDAVIDATSQHGAAVPLLHIPDTVKRVTPEHTISGTLDREELRLAQTPQGARREWLLTALEQAGQQGLALTDEAMALELMGRKVAGVAGDRRNRKITTRDDLEEMRRMLQSHHGGLRIGSGFDIHRFETGRTLVLGGVQFPGEVGLAGHSDADVVLHAAMDALLGAAGLGDIGTLFPPDDEAYAGADSAVLAAQVAGRVEASGFRVINLALTVLAEKPKISARRQEMREAIAGALRLEPGSVGITATTLEGLGALGRGEGIACQAVALLQQEGSGNDG